MRCTFITLFEGLVQGYFSDSILKRALKKGLLQIDFLDPRAFAANKHRKVDDTIAGGGAGMLMMTQPLDAALTSLCTQNQKPHIIIPSPVGKPFCQKDAKRLAATQSHLVFVCGRYEGIDERIVEKWADELFSVGDFIVTGGELPALMICDAVARLQPGVVGNTDSLALESFESPLLEAPSFTRPIEFEGLKIPSEFLKGNHSKINALKKRLALAKTNYFRPERYLKFTQRQDHEKSIY